MSTLRSLFLIKLLFLLSCNSDQVASESKRDKPAHVKQDTALQVKSVAVIQEASGTYPVDSLLETRVLTTGNFHEDEVSKEAEKLPWIGLFKSDEGFYLQSTTVNLTKVHDPVLDEDESVKTGWEVKTKNEDVSYILIEPLPFLFERKVDHISIANSNLNPRDSLKLSFLGQDYTLFATGTVTDQEGTDYGQVTDYKLFLVSQDKGQQVKQLILSLPSLDETMIQILFAGDIDGDKKLDLIINTSWHYNMVKPTLYLSAPAKQGELLKPMGYHESVGC